MFESKRGLAAQVPLWSYTNSGKELRQSQPQLRQNALRRVEEQHSREDPQWLFDAFGFVHGRD
jgi:hypothetical protein